MKNYQNRPCNEHHLIFSIHYSVDNSFAFFTYRSCLQDNVLFNFSNDQNVQPILQSVFFQLIENFYLYAPSYECTRFLFYFLNMYLDENMSMNIYGNIILRISVATLVSFSRADLITSRQETKMFVSWESSAYKMTQLKTLGDYHFMIKL